jgi:hypothetical protein
MEYGSFVSCKGGWKPKAKRLLLLALFVPALLVGPATLGTGSVQPEAQAAVLAGQSSIAHIDPGLFENARQMPKQDIEKLAVQWNNNVALRVESSTYA